MILTVPPKIPNPNSSTRIVIATSIGNIVIRSGNVEAKMPGDITHSTESIPMIASINNIPVALVKTRNPPNKNEVKANINNPEIGPINLPDKNFLPLCNY